MATGLSVLLLGQILLNAQLYVMDGELSSNVVAEDTHKPDPVLVDALSFGHVQSAVDWFWIRALTESSMRKVKPGEHGAVYYNLDLLTDLDPMFFEVFVAGPNLLAVVYDDGLGAKDLLLKGERFRKDKLPLMSAEFRENFWPRPWSLPLTLAYVYLFELKNMPSAATAYREAAQIPGSPRYLAEFEKKLDRPGGQYEVGVRMLAHMMEGEKDERVREELAIKKNNLIIGQYLFHANRSYREFVGEGASIRVLRQSWKKYLQKTSAPSVDPWGGNLSVNESGLVVSTTPHVSVLGLK